MFTWGLGEFGELGHGDARVKYVPSKVESFSKGRVASVACGARHTVFLTCLVAGCVSI